MIRASSTAWQSDTAADVLKRFESQLAGQSNGVAAEHLRHMTSHASILRCPAPYVRSRKQ